MASLYVADRALRYEIVERIKDLAPRKYTQTRFREYVDKERQIAKLEECVGKLRLFELVGGDLVERSYFGGGYVGTRLEYTLRIMYPLHEEHRIAALDDADRIHWDLLTHTSTVSGVAMRLVDHKKKPTFTRVEKDGWEIMEIVVYAIIDCN